jgi:ABC-2 type transport system permease protein
LTAPGSLLWLLAQQLRVSWRSLSARWLLWLLGAALLLDLGASLFYVQPLRRAGQALSGFSVMSGWGLLIGAGATLLLLTLLLSAAIRGMLESLFERGDLDLLLGSPLPPYRVLASRLLGVMLGGLPFYLVLALLITIPGLVAGVWRVLGLWPWLLSLAAVATGLGAALTLGLVRLLGVRRAKTVAGVLGAVVGAAFFLLSQAGNLAGRNSALSRWVAGLNPSDLPSPDSALWWPVRTLWLEGLPTLFTVLLAASVLALASAGLSRIFTTGAQVALSHEGSSRPVRVRAGPLRFASGSRAVLLKEWRLLGRDPLLLSRTLLSVIYLVPLGFTLLRRSGDNLSWQLVGLIGILALGNLTTSLTQITANAEEAPDLLLSSPAPLGRLRWLKLLAAVLPVLTVWALIAVLSLGLSFTPLLLLALPLGLWSIVGGALIILWRPFPIRRADLMQRKQKSADWVAGLTILLLDAALLGALFWLPMSGFIQTFGAVALGVALLIPLVVYALGHQRR